MTEADLLTFVLDTAQVYGWKTFHARPAMTSKGMRTAVQGDGGGFVDLVMVHARQCSLIFAELKAENGKVRPAQEAWLDALRAASGRYEFHAYNNGYWGGTLVTVWRPSDKEEITRLLSFGRARCA